MASSSSSCCQNLYKYRSVIVSKDLMQLIKEETDPAEGVETDVSPASLYTQTTMDELLMHMKNYIVKHKLFDPVNPHKIVLHENKLGSLLGKSEFLLSEVWDILLQKIIIPVSEKNCSEVICLIDDKMCVSRKTKSDKSSEFSTKGCKIVERDDGKGAEGSDRDESMHSFQDYKTEFRKDSASDENFSVNGLMIAVNKDVDVEHEIETDDSDFSCESDSDIEDIAKSAFIAFIAPSSDSGSEYLADESSGIETDSEQKLSEELHYYELSEPKNERAEQRKRRWKAFPRKKIKLSKICNGNKDSSNHKPLAELPGMPTESLTSPFSSCKDNTEVYQSPSNNFKADKDHIQTKLDKQLCLFCCAKYVDSSIIHGKVGCKVCCYKCGKKLINANKRCPVCRRNIERIVYLCNS